MQGALGNPGNFYHFSRGEGREEPCDDNTEKFIRVQEKNMNGIANR